MLPFADINVFSSLIKAHLQRTQNTHDKSSKQNSNTSKEFVNQSKSQTVSVYYSKLPLSTNSIFIYAKTKHVIWLISINFCETFVFISYKLHTTDLEAAWDCRCRHALATNENVFHLAELGRSHRSGTGCTSVLVLYVGHICILPVWRGAVRAGKNNLSSSEITVTVFLRVYY